LQRVRHVALFAVLFYIFLFKVNTYADTTNVMIILDASGSMRGQIEGRTKMDIAKTVIRDVIKTMPNNVRLGLRVYGHQSPQFLKNCTDSKLEVALGFSNQDRFAYVLNSIRPQGYSPLAYSLAQAANDFPSNDRNVVVCLTDGIETCDGDPCAVADSLSQKRSIVFHVVGFDVGDADREVLLCIPQLSGGQYFSAQNPRELKDALKDVFELSIDPGFLKLEFEGLSESDEFIYAKPLLDGEHHLFQNVTTHFYTPLVPGNYRIVNFQIKSPIDSSPYSPEKFEIDSVLIKSGEYKDIPLDESAIVRARFIFPETPPEKTTLSFRDHNTEHYIPDYEVDSATELFLLKTGEYDFTCTGKSKEHLYSITVKNQILLPQSYNYITFDLTAKTWPYRYLLFLLIIPAFLLMLINSLFIEIQR